MGRANLQAAVPRPVFFRCERQSESLFRECSSWQEGDGSISWEKTDPPPFSEFSSHTSSLRRDLGIESRPLDDKTLVTPACHHVHAITRLHLEYQLAPAHLDQLDLGHHLHARRCCGLVADVYVGAQSLFAGPVEMRIDRLYASSFEKADQEPGGEYFGHGEKLLRLRVQGQHGLRHRNHETVLIAARQSR